MNEMKVQSTVPSPRRHIEPPAHLSEFYHFVDNPSPGENDDNTHFVHNSKTSPYLSGEVPKAPPTEPSDSEMVTPSGSPANSMPYLRSRAASRVESYQTSMTPSAMDLETLITNNDVSETLNCYRSLVNASEKYRAALDTLNTAAGEFGSSLEKCARLKGTGKACDGLMACSGLQYLIANQQQILVQNLEADFEKPVEKTIDDFTQRHKSTDDEFTKLINDKVRQLKLNEKNNIKLSKQKYRNIISYRTNLQQLTQQLDEIDKLKHDYYLSLFEQVQSASRSILDKARDIVSLETTIYGIIARKGAVGGGLDDLLEDSEILELSAKESTAKSTATKSTGSNNFTLAGSVPIVDGKAGASTSVNGSQFSGKHEHFSDLSSGKEAPSDLENDRKYMENAISTLHAQKSSKNASDKESLQTKNESTDKENSGSEDEGSSGSRLDDEDDSKSENSEEVVSQAEMYGDEQENGQNDTYYTPPIVKIVENHGDNPSIESDEAQQSPVDTSNVLKDLNGVSSDSLKDND